MNDLVACERAMTQAVARRRAAEALPEYPPEYKQAKLLDAKLAIMAARTDRAMRDFEFMVAFYRKLAIIVSGR